MIGYGLTVVRATEPDITGVNLKDPGQVSSSNNDQHSGILGAVHGVSARDLLMVHLRRILAAYYEDLPNTIRLCTKTIIAAKEAGDDSVIAVARMQRSAANLRCVGFEECRSDFKQALQFSIRSEDPELILLFQIARTAVERPPPFGI